MRIHTERELRQDAIQRIERDQHLSLSSSIDALVRSMENGVANIQLKEFKKPFDESSNALMGGVFGSLQGDLHSTYFPIIGEFIECSKEQKYFNLIKAYHLLGDPNDPF